MDTGDINVVKPVVISAVIIVNIILNTLVIAVIARYPQLREDRTALFVFSLTLSDLLMGCTAMPISATLCSGAAPVLRNKAQVLPAIQQFCFLWLSFNCAHSLCWLTLSKMISLLHPFRYEQHFTDRRCYIIICCIWFVGALTAAAGSHTLVPWNLATCFYEVPAASRTSVALKVGFVLCVSPLLVVVYATGRIFCVIVRIHLQITAQVNSIGGHSVAIRNNASLTLQSVRAGRNVLLVCLGVVVLSIPVVTLFIEKYTGSDFHLSHAFQFAAVWMVMCNSFVNSMLYLILFRGVRRKTATLFMELSQLCGVLR